MPRCPGPCFCVVGVRLLGVCLSLLFFSLFSFSPRHPSATVSLSGDDRFSRGLQSYFASHEGDRQPRQPPALGQGRHQRRGRLPSLEEKTDVRRECLGRRHLHRASPSISSLHLTIALQPSTAVCPAGRPGLVRGRCPGVSPRSAGLVPSPLRSRGAARP